MVDQIMIKFKWLLYDQFYSKSYRCNKNDVDFFAKIKEILTTLNGEVEGFICFICKPLVKVNTKLLIDQFMIKKNLNKDSREEGSSEKHFYNCWAIPQ